MKITYRQLKAAGACYYGRARFRQVFGAGGEVTVANIQKWSVANNGAGGGIGILWAVNHVLPAKFRRLFFARWNDGVTSLEAAIRALEDYNKWERQMG
jgi:hypothetical protein